MNEPTIMRYLFCERIAAQTSFGGPEEYKYLKAHPSAIGELLNQHPDLFSIVMLCIFIEHPELLGPGAPSDAFEVLQETVEEILDTDVAGWRSQGVWRIRNIACILCEKEINRPNPALMSAAIENGALQFLCGDCTPPLRMRAMAARGFFMGKR